MHDSQIDYLHPVPLEEIHVLVIFDVSPFGE